MSKEKLEKGTIAVCIFTYNHPDSVRNTLLGCIESYFKAGIDIYYLDASENDKTQKVAETFIDMGYTNLHYLHKIDEYPGQRWNMMAEGAIFQKNYDYIWPSKDSSFVQPQVLEQILDCASRGPDVIAFGFGPDNELRIERYQDAALFYRRWAWFATSIDVTIWKTDTILDGFSVDRYPPIFGWHYLHLFTRLAELESVYIEVITSSGCPIEKSAATESSWEDKIFKVWKDDWIEANRILPECYAPYKPEVIKEAASLSWILGGIPRLKELHDRGTLVPEILDEVRVNWELVSDLPFATVEEIANGTYKDPDTGSLEETIRLLSKIAELADSGDMDGQQVPFDDIKDLLIDTIGMKNRYDEQILDKIREAANTLKALASRYDLKKRELGDVIRVMLSFVIISFS